MGLIEAPTYKRGDVLLVLFPFITDYAQSKPRPAVVIQNDVGNRFSPNLIVAAISGQVPGKNYPINHRLAQGAGGLDRASVVLAGVILTIPKASVIKRIGHFNDSDLRAVDECLRASLAL